ncbi:bifunctional phosphoribosyl-AMP cyclohydrolase /phosphoribosyl-ATP pyrophosphatase protein [Budvicia aquatica]|uniref:Bifunctional phosphoribosyl-AMP cyclohydrolase /phosphoribosyl-ATP pyrophosphatase protein n=1 Tax=Budvicia aquatica TaxID=82979 RepID=A0A484ZP49_9GAMM|nr:bifunctional phosphoribosyl-AMP cyclohydrolase /phosphoribosyl-ATP pyrophosphatase protein [Budvicia aquatica]
MLTQKQHDQLDWEKTAGMIPAVVQHAVSGEVLMLGYMNQQALAETEKNRQGHLLFTHEAAFMDQG